MQTMLPPGSGAVLTAPLQHCPLYPKGVLPGPTRVNLFVDAPGALSFAAVRSHPALVAQIEARYRIAFDRTRLKRGPPVLL